MLDFWLPMLLLFVAATITAIATRRKRDRCLKYFNREPVMILMETGKWLWGRFNAYPKAMELVFENPERDETGIAKASYVLYTPEVDGIRKICRPGEALILTPGESICLEPFIYHKFYGEPGKGTVIVGEVSGVNDDENDNRFLKPLKRFPQIIEDEEPLHYLCNEYPPAK